MPTDGILHEANETREPLFQARKLYSLLDILGGGQLICDKCGRWQGFSALTPSMAREELSRNGWKSDGTQDLCPKCAVPS